MHRAFVAAACVATASAFAPMTALPRTGDRGNSSLMFGVRFPDPSLVAVL